MSFADDVAELPDRCVPELFHPERDHAQVMVALEGHDAALCRTLGLRFGLPVPAVVRLGLHALARPGGRHTWPE